MPNGPVPPPVPPLFPPIPSVPPAIQAAMERIERHLLIKQAIEYVRCRQAGGSVEECLGIYRLLPPKPDDPYLRELLFRVDRSDAIKLLTATRESLLEQVKIVEEILQSLAPATGIG